MEEQMRASLVQRAQVHRHLPKLWTALPALAVILGHSPSFAEPSIGGGEAYVQQCIAAGVPRPPTWNYEDAWHQRNGSKWKKATTSDAQILEGVFISENLTAEVFYYDPAEYGDPGDGVCIALPRSEFSGREPEDGPPDSIIFLGVICQGRVTSKACFWDNGSSWQSGGVDADQTLTFGDGNFEDTFAGGSDLTQGVDVCTDCHRGENVYIVHPLSTLGAVPNLMPSNWVDPIVPGTWPMNEGPSSLFSPSETGSCLDCHRQGSIGGRFPEVSTDTTSYCGFVRQAFGTTMPPGEVDPVREAHPPYVTLDNACNGIVSEKSSFKKLMSFDAPSSESWASTSATLTDVTTPITEGEGAMRVSGGGYVRLDSNSFDTWSVEYLGTKLAIDLYVPPGQPNPYWLGSAQLFVSIPGAGINSYFVSQIELTPGGTGWKYLKFNLPQVIRTALAQPQADVRFGIAINKPQNAPAMTLDNLRFDGDLSMPPAVPVFDQVEDFERESAWSEFDGSIVAAERSDDVAFLGRNSLQADFAGGGASRIWTQPSEGPAPGKTVSFSVYIPPGTPLSAVQPYVEDANYNWAQTWNTNLPRGGWVTVTTTVPASAALPIREVGVKFYLNAPYNGSIYLDAVRW